MHMSKGRQCRPMGYTSVRVLLATTALATLLAATSARAADPAPAPPTPADKPQEKPAGGTIENVTVTAQKVRQSILNVPINVTSVSGEDARTSRIETPSDLANAIPNVDVKTNIPGAQQIITVRGVGLDDFSSTNNPTVGVYIDDVFLASFAEMDFNFYDLERIEVL
jgi:iron complex outermembrane receptor protein